MIDRQRESDAARIVSVLLKLETDLPRISSTACEAEASGAYRRTRHDVLLRIENLNLRAGAGRVRAEVRAILERGHVAAGPAPRAIPACRENEVSELAVCSESPLVVDIEEALLGGEPSIECCAHGVADTRTEPRAK